MPTLHEGGLGSILDTAQPWDTWGLFLSSTRCGPEIKQANNLCPLNPVPSLSWLLFHPEPFLSWLLSAKEAGLAFSRLKEGFPQTFP